MCQCQVGWFIFTNPKSENEVVRDIGVSAVYVLHEFRHN